MIFTIVQFVEFSGLVLNVVTFDIDVSIDSVRLVVTFDYVVSVVFLSGLIIIAIRSSGVVKEIALSFNSPPTWTTHSKVSGLNTQHTSLSYSVQSMTEPRHNVSHYVSLWPVPKF